MKKHIRSIFASWICFVVCFLSVMTVKAESAREWKQKWYTTRYYPIYQELNEREDFAKRVEGISYEGMLDILNPPDDLLAKMSSQELAELIREYPLMGQVMTYFGPDGELDYSMLYGFLESESDIFYELLRREDGITAILNAYGAHEPDLETYKENMYSVQSERMFLAELFGCHFIRYYAHLFTDEEYELACRILAEKEEIYAKFAEIVLSDYWELPKIEKLVREAVSGVRTLYLSKEEVQEREERIKSRESEKKPVDNKRRYQKAMVGAGAAAGVLCVVAGGYVFARRNAGRKRKSD